MALFPGAVLKLIPRHNKPLKVSQLILHTAVSNASSLYGYFSNPNTDVASHFYVREDGTVEQYVDTRFQAPANYKANTSAISVETWDDLKPATTPWTARQLLSLVRLAIWAHEVHGVPYRLCPSPSSSGIGWHAMWGAPSAWTPAAGKVCPGPARIPQIATLVALAARPVPTPQEDLLSALTPDEQREVLDRLRNLDGIVTRSGLGSKLTSLVDGKTQGFLDNYILWADGKLDTIIKKLGN